MRVTSKGQVTIPKPVRERLGIGPGSEVEFVERDNVVELVRRDETIDGERRRQEIRAALTAMRGTLDLDGLTTDEYIDMIRGPRDDLDAR